MHIKFNLVLPDGAFRPYTAIQTNILCIGRGNQTKPMLVCKMNEVTDKDIVIAEIKKYLETGKAKLGDEINPSQFNGYSAFEKQKVVEKQIVRSGYPLTNILGDEYLEDLAALKEDGENAAVNSVYIPKIGKSPVLINLSDSHLRNPRNYYRITFKKDALVSNEYVANYLNSYVGILIRESKFVGSVIPSMRLGSLKDEGLEIPLPKIVEQEKIVKLHRELDAVAEQAREFQDKLWNFPAAHKSINEEAKELIQKAPEDAWIEELPYPLASILKRFYNETDVNKQYSLVLHFFEALSELLTAIHLGAYVSNQELYERFKKDTEVGDKLASVISSSNFGGWILFLNDSNKFIKRGLSVKADDEGLKNSLLAAFGTSSEDYMQKLVNSTITIILEKTVGLRNSTKGHGPYVDVPQGIYASSLQLLAEIRKPLLAIFSNVSVVVYDSSETINENEIKYSVKVLRGSNPILPNKGIELPISRILTKEFVYLYSEFEESIVKISSIVKMGALPDNKKIGFYFYNSKSKWKSYEFETEFESDDGIIYKELQI